MKFRDSYCNIQGWMIEDLHLGGNELIVYAVIFGFCRDGSSWYKLSQEYVAKWCGITTRGLRKILKSLEEKGLLLIKYHGKGEVSEYKALKPDDDEVEELSSASTGTEFRQYRNSVPPVEELSSANTSNNIYNNINNNNKENIIKENSESEKDSVPESSARKKGSKEKFIKPTVEEIRAYCRERNNIVDAERFYDYYESNGWKVGKNTMKDWKAAVRTWERNGFDTGKRGSDPFDVRNQFWDDNDPTVH